MAGRLSKLLLIYTLAAVVSLGNSDHSRPRAIVTVFREQNYKQFTHCSLPLALCALEQEWVMIFYGSQDRHQLESMLLIARGYKEELKYAALKQATFEENDQFAFPMDSLGYGGIAIPLPTGNSTKVFPNLAFIDCYTESSLCPNLKKNRLPLTLYSNANGKKLKYDGYITLPGLLSFIKEHDPATSLLAVEFVEDAEEVELTQSIASNRASTAQIEKGLQNLGNPDAVLQEIQAGTRTPNAGNQQASSSPKQSETAFRQSQPLIEVSPSSASPPESGTENDQSKTTEKAAPKKGASSKEEERNFIKDATNYFTNLSRSFGLPSWLVSIIEICCYILFTIIYVVFAILAA